MPPKLNLISSQSRCLRIDSHPSTQRTWAITITHTLHPFWSKFRELTLHGSRKKTLPHRVLIHLTYSGTSLSPKPLDTCLSTHPTCCLLCCPQLTCFTYHVIYQLLVTYCTHCTTIPFAPQEPAVMFRQGGGKLEETLLLFNIVRQRT